MSRQVHRRWRAVADSVRTRTTDRDKPVFRPVLLDFSHDGDYAVFIHTFQEHEGAMQNGADNERERTSRGE